MSNSSAKKMVITATGANWKIKSESGYVSLTLRKVIGADDVIPVMKGEFVIVHESLLIGLKAQLVGLKDQLIQERKKSTAIEEIHQESIGELEDVKIRLDNILENVTPVRELKERLQREIKSHEETKSKLGEVKTELEKMLTTQEIVHDREIALLRKDLHQERKAHKLTKINLGAATRRALDYEYKLEAESALRAEQERQQKKIGERADVLVERLGKAEMARCEAAEVIRRKDEKITKLLMMIEALKVKQEKDQKHIHQLMFPPPRTDAARSGNSCKCNACEKIEQNTSRLLNEVLDQVP